MTATEIEVIDLQRKLSKLTLTMSDYMSLDRILGLDDLRMLEVQVREALKILE